MSEGTVAVLEPLSTGDPVDVDRELLIGRDEKCDMVLSGPTISHHHARISLREDGTIWLTDCRSTNGTYWNGQRLRAEAKLSPGDSVRFDRLEYRFRIRRVRQPTAIAPSGTSNPASWARDPAKSKTELFDEEELQQYLATVAKPHARAVRQPYLEFLSGSQGGRCLRLTGVKGDDRWTIGSAERNDIVLKDAGVSESHADLVNRGAKWRIADVISSNGTQVNGEDVAVRYLDSGDQLRFGSVVCIFRFPVPGVRVAKRYVGMLLLGAALFALLMTSFIAWWAM